MKSVLLSFVAVGTCLVILAPSVASANNPHPPGGTANRVRAANLSPFPVQQFYPLRAIVRILQVHRLMSLVLARFREVREGLRTMRPERTRNTTLPASNTSNTKCPEVARLHDIAWGKRYRDGRPQNSAVIGRDRADVRRLDDIGRRHG